MENKINKINESEFDKQNNIEKGPINYLAGSITSFLFFVLSYILSKKIALYVSFHRPSNSSDVVQNISNSLNTLIVGLAFLATFSFGFIGVGLFIVFIRSFLIKKD